MIRVPFLKLLELWLANVLISLISSSEIIISMRIWAFISIVACSIHIKMSAFNCLKLWVRCVLIILFKIVIHLLKAIARKFVLFLIISTSVLIITVKASCFCHVILEISSEISFTSKISTIVAKRLMRMILTLIFLCKVYHVLLYWIFWLSKFFISMSKVTFHTKDARLMSIKVPASFCLVFLVNFWLRKNICILILIKWLWLVCSKRQSWILERILIWNILRIQELALHHNLLLYWKSILWHHLNSTLISLWWRAFLYLGGDAHLSMFYLISIL